MALIGVRCKCRLVNAIQGDENSDAIVNNMVSVDTFWNTDDDDDDDKLLRLEIIIYSQ